MKEESHKKHINGKEDMAALQIILWKPKKKTITHSSVNTWMPVNR